MNRQQVEMFLSLSKTLNFTKTANEFYTSQPTISRQIGLLEEEWGLPLFIRSKREVRLTPSGTIMCAKCKESLALIDEGLVISRKAENGDTGKIKIGILESMNSSFFVTPLAASFNKKYPDIYLGFEKRSFAELREKLSSGYFDMIFTLDFDLRELSDITYYTLCDVNAGILMSINNPLAKNKDLKVKDFENETFILPDPLDSPGRKKDLLNIFSKLGLNGNKIIYFENMESVMFNIRAGKGVSLLDSSNEDSCDKDHFRFFPVSSEIAPVAVVYAWKSSNTNPSLARFVNTLFLRENIDVFFN